MLKILKKFVFPAREGQSEPVEISTRVSTRKASSKSGGSYYLGTGTVLLQTDAGLQILDGAQFRITVAGLFVCEPLIRGESWNTAAERKLIAEGGEVEARMGNYAWDFVGDARNTVALAVAAANVDLRNALKHARKMRGEDYDLARPVAETA